MRYLGIFNKGDDSEILGPHSYSSRKKQEIIFEWLNDTTAVLLNIDNNSQIKESFNSGTKQCLFEDENLSENLQIVAFDYDKNYFNHDTNDLMGENDVKCQMEQIACKDRSRCINEPWICDDLEDCEDKTDEEFEFCNKRAGCCLHGVIFNSKTPTSDRFKVLGESASQAIGVYKPKDFEVSRNTTEKRIKYEQYTGTQLTLDWVNKTNSWRVFKYKDQGENEPVWIGPSLEKINESSLNDRCVNQNHSTSWKYLPEGVTPELYSSKDY